MAKSPVRKEINGRNYDIGYLSPKTALRVLTRLIKVVGEPLGMVAGAAGSVSVGSLLDGDVPPNAIANAAKALTERLDENEVISTIEQLLEQVLVQGDGDRGTRKISIERDFEGAIGEMLKVVTASLEVNYADFFGGKSLGDALAAASSKKTA